MAELKTDDRVCMGQLIPVGEIGGQECFALKVEDSSGDNEQWLLFTRGELFNCSKLEIPSITESWKKGRMFQHRMYTYRIGHSFLAVRVSWPKTWALSDEVLLLTSELFKRALSRTAKNPEYVPKMSYLADLLD